jgi:hypothetical protein
VNTPKSDQASMADRTQAAVLLATVSRDETAAEAVRLHCLFAVDVLAEAATWTERHGIDSGDVQARITRALRLLGRLPLEQFGQADVLTATRHARRALRELR